MGVLAVPHAEERLIHDLRNAASVIRGAALQLREDRDELDPVTVDQLMEMIHRRSDMIVRLVGDLSILRQVGRGDLRVVMQPVDVGLVCRQAVTGVSSADREVTVDVDPDVVALGDPLRVTQVLDNLLGNALRYGGPHVTVSAVRTGDDVRLTVADDGEGVPPELLDSLFEVYARGPLSDEHGGSGLGLAIVQELCAALGGHVEYDGASGSSFHVTLQAPPRVHGTTLTPDGSHALLVWDDLHRLREQMVSYTLGGLERGEAVVVAAREELLAQNRLKLERLGVPTDRLLTSEQLVPLDADELAAALPVDGRIDVTRFHALAGTVLERVTARWRSVRVFSEVGGLLHRQEEGLSLELEQLWARAADRPGVGSLCVYPRDGADVVAEPVRACHDTLVAA